MKTKTFGRLPVGWARVSVVVWDRILKGKWERWLYLQFCTLRWMRPVKYNADTLARMYVKAEGGNVPKVGSNAARRPRTQGGSVANAVKMIGKARASLAKKGVIGAKKIWEDREHCHYEVWLTDGTAAKRYLAQYEVSAFDYIKVRTTYMSKLTDS